MKTIKLLSIALLAFSFTISSCKKDPDEVPAPVTPPATSGSLKLHFENMVGDSTLVLNMQNYVNANNDTFNVSKFNYYISNIKLTRSDNSVYTETESYHLLKADDESSLDISLANVPFGSYTAIEFMIGVDSTRNVSGAQTGALDPANGMFWSWSSGYIMAKLEGTSPQSTGSGHMIMMHIGGFSGANKVLKTVSPSFNSQTANVSSTVTPEIHFKADILEMLQSPNTIDFSTLNVIHMPGSAAKTVADNYADMFSVEHIHND